MMKKVFVAIILALTVGMSLHAQKLHILKPLLSFGGGYLDAGRHHSGGCVQLEYKWARKFWGGIRPQASVALLNLNSIFAGIGIGAEIYFGDHIVFSPNFEPGVYFTSHGRDLGSVLEFRSCIEAAYEFSNGARLGGQFWHISNAGIGHRNPGENVALIFIAFPFF